MSDTLIRVAKDGAHISVHPTCLAAHQAAGWSEAADQTPASTDLGLADPLDHDGNGRKGGSTADGEGFYGSMTVPDLKALAETRGIDLGDASKKADIIAAIELADEAAAATEAQPAAE